MAVPSDDVQETIIVVSSENAMHHLLLILLTCLDLAGVPKVLQMVAVEMTQRRQFFHIVGDLTHRLLRANQEHYVSESEHGAESTSWYCFRVSFRIGSLIESVSHLKPVVANCCPTCG